MKTLRKLSAIVGKERLAWRYDPVLLTEKCTIQTHLETFDMMAQELTPLVERCIFSFVEMYKKLETNMPELIPLTEEDQNALAKGMGLVADKYGLYLQTCGTSCKYCYANKKPDKAQENYRYHDPDSPLLLGNVRETDVVQQGSQKSFLTKVSQ